MKVVSHIKKVKKVGPPHPSVHPFVVTSGLLPLCDILYEYPDIGFYGEMVSRN